MIRSTIYAAVLALGLLVESAVAQSSQLSMSVTAAPNLSVNSTNTFQNGVTANGTHVTVQAKQNVYWTLTVSGTNFINGINSIPASQVGLRATNTDCAVFPEFLLSSTPQNLARFTVANNIQGSADRTINLNIAYALRGGTQLLVPGGSYTSTVTFTLTQN